MNDDKNLREEKLLLRNGLSETELANKSKNIEKKILTLDLIAEAKSIFIYVSFRSEVRTISLIEKLLQSQKVVSVPITHVKNKNMDAVKIKDMSSDLVAGYCGILEPNQECLSNNLTTPEDIDVVIIPGSVFDERGGRFGYGGGYYDRFLEQIPKATRMGLAYDIQLVKRAPIQPHDELLDIIVTEKRVIKNRRKQL